MTGNILGPVREFKGGQLAEVGHWLVVFKNNKPDSLFGTGVKIRKLINAPAIGARVASLNTMPQDASCLIRDITTRDGYTIPTVTVRLQIRVTPENRGAPSALISLIERDGVRFFEGIEASVRHRVEGHVRDRIRQVDASAVLRAGPMRIVFPSEALDLARPEVSVTSIQGIDWEEGHLAREVREAEELDRAERAKEQLDHEAREREARSNAHRQQLDAVHALQQHQIDAELARRDLAASMERAQALGIDPLAIAEPDVWMQISQQHGEVLSRLLESQHLYPLLRSSPDLMRAIVDRLGGGSTDLAMGRQADMVLDRLDPERVLALPGATVHSGPTSSSYLERAGLIVHPLISGVWDRAGGHGDLLGAGYAAAPGQASALVLLVGRPKPVVPGDFSSEVLAALRSSGSPLQKVGVYEAEGSNLPEALTAFVRRISPQATPEIALRESGNVREALVTLTGPLNETKAVFETMTDPANPILPALESLIDNRARIRFARPLG
ncbi:MAG: hypothetical protein KDA37_14830 [Planctomycetales bacterium]|nr:hypothetical protein [Planctomycetales bacterium]